MNAERAPSSIRHDILTVVGGNYSPDALGPLHQEIRERVRARPLEYLREFEAMFLSGRLDAAYVSNLHPQVLLTMVSDLQPERARRLAAGLASRLDPALSEADSLMEETGSLEALPEESAAMARRLRRRRAALHRLAGGGS